MIVDPDTPYELLKVMDFGLAKLVTPDQFAKITQTHTEFAVGTPGYMCPEQARGEEMDGRGDLYSVGVILYELLTGRLPFAGRSTMDLLLAHVTEEPPPFSFMAADVEVSSGVEKVVQMCMAKSPDDRPRSARELAEKFEAALTGDLEAPAPPPAQPARGWQVQAQESPRPPVRPAEESQPPPEQRTMQVPTAAAQTNTTADADPHDPLAVVHHLEAWMPERIAAYKLRGFIHDVGGEMIESVPGRILVRVGGKGSVYSAPRPGLSWLGIGRRGGNIDMELRLDRTDPSRENQLHITVIFRSPGTDLNASTTWRNVCTQIFCDLRGYLMGQTGTVSATAE